MTWTVFFGVFLSIVGVFLPWGRKTLLPIYGWHNDFFGIQFLFGTVAFISIVFAAIFFLLHMKRELKGSGILALLCGVITLVCILTWGLIPRATGLHWEWSEDRLALLDSPHYVLYVILYGAYISFTGSILTLASMVSLKFLKRFKTD
jgi:hypothetical protein